MITTKQELPKALIDLIQKNDFNINYDYGYINFQKFTDYGQDFNITVKHTTDLKELADLIYVFYDNYDVDYEVTLWIDEFGHGKNGAPYHIKDVVEDMEQAESFILDLYRIVVKYHDNIYKE